MRSQEPALPEPALSRPAPLLGPTTAASALVALACVTGLIDSWAAWHRYSVGMDYIDAVPGVFVADLTSADATGDAVGDVYLIAMVSAAVALLVWFGRVRANVRLLGTHPHRAGWALGAWFASTTLATAVTLFEGDMTSVDDLRQLARTDTASAMVQCALGAVAVVVVRRVTRAQSAPRPG